MMPVRCLSLPLLFCAVEVSAAVPARAQELFELDLDSCATSR